MAGLLRTDGGHLRLEDGDPELSVGEQAHYLGHQDALKPALSVWENLAFWVRFLGGESGVDAALAAVGLAPFHRFLLGICRPVSAGGSRSRGWSR